MLNVAWGVSQIAYIFESAQIKHSPNWLPRNTQNNSVVCDFGKSFEGGLRMLQVFEDFTAHDQGRRFFLREVIDTLYHEFDSGILCSGSRLIDDRLGYIRGGESFGLMLEVVVDVTR